jgi:uncharacterized membrane protein
MPGLRRTDDRTFVAAFQSIDRAIINPWFMASAFLGALVLVTLAAVSQLGRPAQPWVLVALALYLVAVVITATVHVPANDMIKAAGEVDDIQDLAAVRAAFDEARWNAWNLVRALTATGAFASLCWALLVHGQAAGRTS